MFELLDRYYALVRARTCLMTVTKMLRGEPVINKSAIGTIIDLSMDEMGRITREIYDLQEEILNYDHES